MIAITGIRYISASSLDAPGPPENHGSATCAPKAATTIAKPNTNAAGRVIKPSTSSAEATASAPIVIARLTCGAIRLSGNTSG